MENILDVLNKNELNHNYFQLSHSEIVYQNLKFGDLLYFNINKADRKITFRDYANKAKNSHKLLADAKNAKMIKFRNCSFSGHPIIEDTDIVVCNFDNCNFEFPVEMDAEILKQDNRTKEKELTRNDVYFKDCRFSSLEMGSINILNKSVNQRIHILGGIIEELSIQNVEVESKFYINKQSKFNSETTIIESLNICNSIFEENFKLHNCEIKNFILEGTDFKKQADFYKSNFLLEENNDIIFNAINFNNLTIFEKCQFHTKLIFTYVTFNEHCHFRQAVFKQGLDLEKANIMKDMNFFGVEDLDSKESKEKTSQETYRIIKHNFSKIGNTIEANKYHALELGIHNKNTWSQREVTPTLLSDGIVSFLFLITSNFTKWWFLPLFWIFIVGAITASNLGDMSFVNIMKYTIITKYNYMDEYPILFLFNKASLGFLYYQFILSVRKNTRK